MAEEALVAGGALLRSLSGRQEEIFRGISREDDLEGRTERENPKEEP
jgi:hypothetical protein